MKRAVIMGATSGMGWEVAKILASKGWTLGIAARREEKLKELKMLCLGLNSKDGTYQNSRDKNSDDGTNEKGALISRQRIEYQVIDIEQENAPELLKTLIDKIGGMDLYFHGSGVGWQNPELEPQTELKTCAVNTVGFTRMVTAAWQYFKDIQEKSGDEEERMDDNPHGKNVMDISSAGHIAVISSIAGTKGMGTAPSYSATKSFDNTYIQALVQLTHKTRLEDGRRLKIRFTDIRPGFVDTPLLDTTKHHYPMLMDPVKVSRKIVRAIERKKRVAVIDWRYKILVFLWRLIPNCIWERIKL